MNRFEKFNKEHSSAKQFKLHNVAFELAEIYGTPKNELWLIDFDENLKSYRYSHLGYISLDLKDIEAIQLNKQLSSDVWELYKQWVNNKYN